MANQRPMKTRNQPLKPKNMNDEMYERFEAAFKALENLAADVISQTLAHLKSLSKEAKIEYMQNMDLKILEFTLELALLQEYYEICEVAKELIEKKRREGPDLP